MADPAYSAGTGLIGVGFPWDPSGPSQQTDAELIKTRITIVLSTVKGTHKMEPTFGSNLITLVFENRGHVLRTAADIEIRAVLAQWVKEVRVLAVNVTDESTSVDGLVSIDIDYEYLGQISTWSGTFNSQVAGGL